MHYVLIIVLLVFSFICFGEENKNILIDNYKIRQLTFSSKNHELDNNDNFSFDDKYICYDTRGTTGPGIENCISIEVVDIETGKEYVIYRPEKIRMGTKPAPGLGAVSFHPQKYQLIFIHGPEIHDLYTNIEPEDIYAKNNRRGMLVDFDESLRYKKQWVDLRDTSCNNQITQGAQRGGSHRHEFSGDGQRIGCTYDDWLLPQYGRTVAYMEKTNIFEPHASYYFSILINVVPAERAKDGDIVKAFGDSWLDVKGKRRAFIGTVKEGDSFADYLFIATIPDSVDIQTSNSGTCDKYPEPPHGLILQKITKICFSGIVRGSPDGRKIAFLDKDKDGKTQIFMVDVSSIDNKNDEVFPVQVSYLHEGVEDGIRWHPSGKAIFAVSEGAIIVVCVEKGESFSKTVFLTPKYVANKPYAIVVSRKGSLVAFDRIVPTYDESGKKQVAFDGKDFSQIFLIDYIDENRDGLPEYKTK